MTNITASDVYLFAHRLFYKLHPEMVVKVKDDKSFDALNEIISGEFSLLSDPEDMVAIVPEPKREEALAYLLSRKDMVAEKDQMIAKVIVGSF